MTDFSLHDLRLCFEGAIPAVIATAAADGTPNVTYLSRVRYVDDERVALSNQFFSKTQRNLTENPRASMLVIDPVTYEQYRLELVYERTERRGPIFDQLRADVDIAAAHSNMQAVFKLRAADIYRVRSIEFVPGAANAPVDPGYDAPQPVDRPAGMAALSARLSRCADLDAIVTTTVNGLQELLGFEHSSLLLLDERGERLYTIASHGYDAEGVGSEVELGEGVVGLAAARAVPIRLGNALQLAKYAEGVTRSYEAAGIGPGRDIPAPRLVDVQSRLAVPALALGQLVGVLVVDEKRPVAFTEVDEYTLSVLATLVANAIEVERAREADEDPTSERGAPAAGVDRSTPTTHVRFFAVDGSTFLDGDYLIKGVAGRILWSCLNHYQREQRVEFTNKEVRLDPTLELPDFRDNLDSRLLLLKRRLDERAAPIRIEKTGRGRFRLNVETALRLDEPRASS